MNKTPLIIKESAEGTTCIRIKDELFKSRKIFLTEVVDSESMQSLMEQFLYLSSESPFDEITLYINSPGGEVSSGLALYDVMRLSKTPLRTVCIGTAASMGAILFLAGDKREMLPNSQIMIHDPAPGGGSMAGMKPHEMEENLEKLKKTQSTITDIISSVTKQSKKTVLAKTKKDSFFSAEEALNFGLATDIVQSI